MNYYGRIKEELRKGPKTAAQIAHALGLQKGNFISPQLNQLEALGEVRFSVRRRKKPAVWELVR